VNATEHEPALRYKVQFTASQEFVDLLQEATDLLGHETPQATLPEVQLRALRAFVQQLRTRKRGATKVRPAAAQDSSRVPEAPERVPSVAPDAAPARRGTRHIPAYVRRAVDDRDAGRCAYRDDRGERCRETRRLELHHREPYALGGPPTLQNLELRCRAHNTLAAEEDFGREHMDLARGVADRTATESY
jgi:hypothetical protein